MVEDGVAGSVGEFSFGETLDFHDFGEGRVLETDKVVAAEELVALEEMIPEDEVTIVAGGTIERPVGVVGGAEEDVEFVVAEADSPGEGGIGEVDGKGLPFPTSPSEIGIRVSVGENGVTRLRVVEGAGVVEHEDATVGDGRLPH